MSENKYTPGPWRLQPARNKHYIDKIEGRDYEATSQRCYYIQGPKHTSHFVADLIVATGSEFDNPPPGEANARLISAAPDLLEACKAAQLMLLQTDWGDVRMNIVSAAISKAEKEG